MDKFNQLNSIMGLDIFKWADFLFQQSKYNPQGIIKWLTFSVLQFI